MIWPHFDKLNPCPACGHWDWQCRAGDIKFICMRTASDHPAKDGGWYHDYGQNFKKPVKQWKPAPIKRDLSAIDFSLRADKVIDLANKLGVTFNSLQCLGVGWSDAEQCYLFPMRDGDNNIIGYNRRFLDGTKKVIAGTSAGLYIPQGVNVDTCVYVVEGATDTAAMITLGLYAVGRFNCGSGSNFLKVLLKRIHARRIVIVADDDNDKIPIEDKNNWRYPGIDGAKKLKKELNWPSCIWLPPVKDVREFLKRGGTKQYIERKINQERFYVGL